MELGSSTGWLKMGLLNTLLCAILCSGALGQQSSGSASPSLESIIEGMEKAQSDVRPQVAYQLIREYQGLRGK